MKEQVNHPSPTRRLAAIMFTDIVGYTSLMGENEDSAFQLLKKNREIQKPIIEKHNGSFLKEIGDAILASFPTDSDAVYCAIAIQEACEAEPNLQLRIGIHEGEVVFEDDDVFGDGVNIASRLQAIAPIDGIYISETVNRNVENKEGIRTVFIKEEHLKNIKYPVNIYQVNVGEDLKVKPVTIKKKTSFILPLSLILIVLAFLVYKFLPSIQPPTDQENSIAVLAFENLSGDPNQEYFSDGVSEEIINSLAQIEGLKVAGRTSSFSFKNSEADLITIGNKLSVNMVLEGSVRKSGNQIRITAQLINVVDGFHIWSEQYDAELDDLFDVQSNISNQIAEKLEITLDIRSEKGPSRPTESMEAYESYLKGNYFYNQRVDGVEKALGYYLRAIEIDPDFTQAYIQTALTYYFLCAFDFLPTHEGFPQAREFAEKASEDFKFQAAAIDILAWIDFQYGWDWEKSVELQKKAMDLGYLPPAFLTAWSQLHLYNNVDSAIIISKILVDRDPLSMWSLTNLAQVNLLGGRYDDSRKILNDLLELYPTYSEAHRLLGLSYLYEGDPDRAIPHLEKAESLTSGNFALSNLVCAYAEAGDKEKAQELLTKLKSESERISNLRLAIISAYLGDIDEAFNMLDHSFQDRDFWLVTLNSDPIWDVLRSDPRFQYLVERMNFPKKSE